MSELENTEKKSNGGYVAVIIVLLLIVGLMAYLWSAKNAELNASQLDNKKLNDDMKAMNDMLQEYVGDISNDFKTDFRNMLATYDALIEKDASKADSLNMQKDQIRELQAKVESGKLTARELINAKKEIEVMRQIMRGYVYQIDSLNTALYETRSNLQNTTDALNMTTAERDEYRTQSENLTQQVKKGSKLNAYNFNTVGLKEKLNSTMTETDRAKNVLQIRSDFTIGKNAITEAGKKTVYMQVIDPSGKTMQTNSSFIVKTDNGDVPYSDKKDIDYQNESVDLSVYFSLRNLTATKGNYKVNIYCQGQLIGSDSFTLK